MPDISISTKPLAMPAADGGVPMPQRMWAILTIALAAQQPRRAQHQRLCADRPDSAGCY